MQTRAELLKNLAKARAVRKQNLAMRKRSPQPQRRVVQKRVRPQSRFVRVARNVPIINPQLLSQQTILQKDVDVTSTDVGVNESIIAKGESLFHSIEDVLSKPPSRRRQ